MRADQDFLIKTAILKRGLRVATAIKETLPGRAAKLEAETESPDELRKTLEVLQKAQERANDLAKRAATEQGYLCPRCWVEAGTENVLSSLDARLEIERLKCPQCGISLWGDYQDECKRWLAGEKNTSRKNEGNVNGN